MALLISLNRIWSYQKRTSINSQQYLISPPSCLCSHNSGVSSVTVDASCSQLRHLWTTSHPLSLTSNVALAALPSLLCHHLFLLNWIIHISIPAYSCFSLLKLIINPHLLPPYFSFYLIVLYILSDCKLFSHSHLNLILSRFSLPLVHRNGSYLICEWLSHSNWHHFIDTVKLLSLNTFPTTSLQERGMLLVSSSHPSCHCLPGSMWVPPPLPKM